MGNYRPVEQTYPFLDLTDRSSEGRPVSINCHSVAGYTRNAEGLVSVYLSGRQDAVLLADKLDDFESRLHDCLEEGRRRTDAVFNRCDKEDQAEHESKLAQQASPGSLGETSRHQTPPPKEHHSPTEPPAKDVTEQPSPPHRQTQPKKK